MIIVTLADEKSFGEEIFTLSVGEFSRLNFQIKENVEVTEELYDTLRLADGRTKALAEAVRLLSLGSKSKREITRKLTSKGFSRESAEHAIKLLEKKGYINDAKSCESIADGLLRSKKYGKDRIVSYLIGHGYSAEDAKAAVSLLEEDDLSAALRHQISRKFPDIAVLPYEKQTKAIKSLMRLGFSYREIKAEIKNMREE